MPQQAASSKRPKPTKRAADNSDQSPHKKARAEQQPSAVVTEQRQETSAISQEKVRAALAQKLAEKKKTDQQPLKPVSKVNYDAQPLLRQWRKHQLTFKPAVQQPKLVLSQPKQQALEQLKGQWKSSQPTHIKSDLVNQLCDTWSRHSRNLAECRAVARQIPEGQRQQYEIAAFERYFQYIL